MAGRKRKTEKKVPVPLYNYSDSDNDLPSLQPGHSLRRIDDYGVSYRNFPSLINIPKKQKLPLCSKNAVTISETLDDECYERLGDVIPLDTPSDPEVWYDDLPYPFETTDEDDAINVPLSKDYSTLLENLSKQWLMVEASHRVSQECTDSFWKLALKSFHELIETKKTEH